MWPNQNYKLLHSKGNHRPKKKKKKGKERQCIEWERISANNVTSKGLISKYTAYAAQQQKKQPNQKVDRRTK